MRGAKLSSWRLLIAFVIACVISVPAFSGEHPWDSDNSSGTNGGVGGGSDTAISTPVVVRTAAHNSNNSVLRSLYSPMSFVFTVSYFAAERLYAKMYGAGGRTTQQTKSVSR